MLEKFEIPEALKLETVWLRDLKLSTVLLMRDRDLPWVVLVPRRDKITEVFELAPTDREELMQEIVLVSKILKSDFKVDKVNIGMIGNILRTLHVHVLGRFVNDREFPNTIWGKRIEIDSEKNLEFTKRIGLFQQCFQRESP